MKVGSLEQALRADPSTSYWLKEQFVKTQQRDPVDALRDAEALVAALKSRLELLSGYPDRNEHFNPALCDECFSEAERYGYEVADVGVCGQCGSHRDCFDKDLIDRYYNAGLTADEIHRHLPRLRVSGIRENNPIILSWSDIDNKIQQIDVLKANAMLGIKSKFK